MKHFAPRFRKNPENNFLNFLLESLTARIKEQVKDQLPQILPKEVSNFTPLVIEKLIKESHDEVTLEKPKKKDSTSGSSKGTKSQPKSSGKSVQSKEPVFEVADSDMPHDQEGNMGDNEDEPWKETASRRDWFKKPTPPQEPTDPDWNIGKTTQEGPTQNWLMTLAASTSTDKSLKDFDELIITPIDISGYILNGLKIEIISRKIPARERYSEFSKAHALENPEGGDYPFDLSKPLPLITRGNRQRVPFEFFINNDSMTWFQNIWSPRIQSRGDVYSTKRVFWQSGHVKVMRKHGYGYLEEIVVRRADNILYRFKEEHSSDTYVFTVKMEILLEPTSNKLTVDPHGFEGTFKDGDGVPSDSRRGSEIIPGQAYEELIREEAN
ncbi:hypothetical protein Tco_0558847 [Tanacetum coccineum]